MISIHSTTIELIVCKGKHEQVVVRRKATGIGIGLDFERRRALNRRSVGKGGHGWFGIVIGRSGMLGYDALDQRRLLFVIVNSKGRTSVRSRVDSNFHMFPGSDFDHLGPVTTENNQSINQSINQQNVRRSDHW